MGKSSRRKRERRAVTPGNPAKCCTRCRRAPKQRGEWCHDCHERHGISVMRRAAAKPLDQRRCYRGADWSAYLAALEAELSRVDANSRVGTLG